MKLRETLKKAASFIDFKDILMLAGLIMAGKGLYMLFQPAMWLVIGIFLIYLGWPKRGGE